MSNTVTAPQESAPSDVDMLFERSLLDVGIPPCPVILNRFMVEAGKDEPDFKRLESIISADVGISASLIKTANAPYFGMRQRVRSVSEALTVLGLNVSSRAIAGIVLRNSFPNVPNLERFWDASARIARLSGWLAQHLELRGLRAEDAYTFGLFRDCGIPVLLKRFSGYEETLTAANGEQLQSFTAIEEAAFPTNHAMVGCLLAQSWWLPEEICLAIRNHHDLAVLKSAESHLPLLSRRLVATAQFAEHIVQRQLSLSITQEWPKLGEACLELLDVGESDLERLYTEAEPVASASE
ncbi:HDOD domain-containing protein [Ferrigenium kumadai]|uniref:HDOD domain-containing protein n=1 Tax=Ferrigenium kumadai TaxID=1682490 RepID=A0AAN1SYL1_9PROT|nr:HDOD domain-containing protein [Ferrigenium kumadai]BBI99445.1 HDOD domain-containing protein [Ferrigenium kumadai]